MNISEYTTPQALKQVGYTNRRPYRVSLLSLKNRKRRLQFTQAHQKTGKMLTGVMSLDICYNAWMVELKFGLNNMKA